MAQPPVGRHHRTSLFEMVSELRVLLRPLDACLTCWQWRQGVLCGLAGILTLETGALEE